MTHLTLNTGHSRQSPRSEVSAETLRFLAPTLRCDTASLPGLWSIKTHRTTGYATVDILHESLHVAVIGTAWTKEGAQKLWPELQALALSQNIPPRGFMPPPPFTAVLLLPSAGTLTPDSLMQMGDLGRCLGWAIMTDQPGG